jgi:hypothetical protein
MQALNQSAGLPEQELLKVYFWGAFTTETPHNLYFEEFHAPWHGLHPLDTGATGIGVKLRQFLVGPFAP